MWLPKFRRPSAGLAELPRTDHDHSCPSFGAKSAIAILDHSSICRQPDVDPAAHPGISQGRQTLGEVAASWATLRSFHIANG
jgi:hypothetical protein